MLTNFFYTKSVYLGKEYHTLRYSAPTKYGQELTPHTVHMHYLIDCGNHQESVRVAGLHTGNFMDYFLEGLKHITPTKMEINLLYRSYHSYLTLGVSSSNRVVAKICQTKPSPMVSVATSKNYHSFITPLLKSMNDIQQTYFEYLENGLITEQPETSLLIESLLKIMHSNKQILGKEKAAARRNATPHTRATGSKNNRISFTSHIPYEETFQKPIEEHQYFPLDKITDLIENASCYRNACLYSLIAATNARDSEADQILWRDVNIETREILLIKPTSRTKFYEAYRGLSEAEINKLQWKGRGTPLTVLLEPYGKLFFDYLQLYLEHEYIPNCGHNFIFHNKHGRPLFLSDYSSVLLHQFKKSATRALPEDPHIAKKLGLHSLRHSYIFFMKNYLEHSNGQGLSDSELILLTGHSDIRSLQKYAKADWELLLEKISFANHMRKQGNIISITEFQIKYLEERLAQFKQELKRHEPKGK